MSAFSRRAPILQRGFTLIELMIALLLGLLVVGAAGSLFLSNKRVYGATEAIGRIQENQRTAFEILARDIREAGANPCMRFEAAYSDQLGIQLAAPSADFWGRFAAGIFGEEAAGVGGSDQLTLYSADDRTFSVTEHKRSSDVITVSSTTSGISDGQELIVCNNDYAVAFAASDVTSTGSTIGHAGSANCSGNLTRPRAGSNDCTATNANPVYCFSLGAGVSRTAADTTACPGGIGTSPAYVAVPTAATWTIANNGRGGTSLYRTFAGTNTEIAEGVTRLQLAYKVGSASDYVDASAVTSANAWSQVTAVHVQMTFQAVQGALGRGDVTGTDNATLSRTLEDYVVLRNHQEIQ